MFRAILRRTPLVRQYGRFIRPTLLAGAIAILGFWAPSASAQGVPLAAGHGHFDWLGGIRSFSFAAVEFEDGTVVGQAQVYIAAWDLTAHFELDCSIYSEDDDTLVLGGEVTHSSWPELVGQPIMFGVRDNGQGSRSEPDEISGFLFLDCQPPSIFGGREFFEVEGGNIVVFVDIEGLD